MKNPLEEMVVFTGNGSTALAADTTAAMGVELAPAIVGKFSNDEVRVQLQANVRGKDIYIFQSFGDNVSDRLMEMWLMIDAAKRASADRVTAVIPWYPYCKQERKFRGREPISARMVADLTVEAGADRILTMDLHEGAIQGFFDVPVDHLPNLPVFVQAFREEGLTGPRTVIVAPDAGAVERASDIAAMLGCGIAVIFKHHPEGNIEDAETVETVGELEGKRALLVDDFIFGGSTLVNAAREVKMAGATEVNACVTHAILCGDALERIGESDITKLYVTDTIPPQPSAPEKIRVITIAPLLAQAIARIHCNESVSGLLDEKLESRE